MTACAATAGHALAAAANNRGVSMSQPLVLVFWIDARRFALPAVAVDRVVRAVEITALPGAPETVLGTIVVGSRVLPVLDLRRRLKLPPRRPRPDDRLMIVDTGQGSVVLPVDAVDAVFATPASVLAGRGIAHEPAGALEWIDHPQRLFSPADADAFAHALASGSEAALA